jgi:hypothetical protein
VHFLVQSIPAYSPASIVHEDKKHNGKENI